MSLLLPVFACCLVAGCGPAKYANSQSAGYTDYAAPQLEQPLPAPVQAQGIQLVQQYVSAMNRKDYQAAAKMLAPELRAQWPPSTIAWQMTKGGYWMLAGSTDWHYDQVQGLKHGKEMVVHVRFNATDGNLYKSNFSFVNTGGQWLIDMILNPVQKTKLQLTEVNKDAPGRK